MKKMICLLILLSGCGGRLANPVSVYYPGDEKLNCDSLKLEMAKIQKELDALRPKTNKFATNAIWFFVSPMMMDTKDAEKVEYNALIRRHNRLLVLAKEKNCSLEGLATEPLPTIEEYNKLVQKTNPEKQLPNR